MRQVPCTDSQRSACNLATVCLCCLLPSAFCTASTHDPTSCSHSTTPQYVRPVAPTRRRAPPPRTCGQISSTSCESSCCSLLQL